MFFLFGAGERELKIEGGVCVIRGIGVRRTHRRREDVWAEGRGAKYFFRAEIPTRSLIKLIECFRWWPQGGQQLSTSFPKHCHPVRGAP